MFICLSEKLQLKQKNIHSIMRNEVNDLQIEKKNATKVKDLSTESSRSGR